MTKRFLLASSKTVINSTDCLESRIRISVPAFLRCLLIDFLQGPEEETRFRYCWRVKSSFKLVWMESTYPCNSPFVEAALLLIGLTHISFIKNQ
jgi:hypothetical protein